MNIVVAREPTIFLFFCLYLLIMYFKLKKKKLIWFKTSLNGKFYSNDKVFKIPLMKNITTFTNKLVSYYIARAHHT